MRALSASLWSVADQDTHSQVEQELMEATETLSGLANEKEAIEARCEVRALSREELIDFGSIIAAPVPDSRIGNTTPGPSRRFGTRFKSPRAI